MSKAVDNLFKKELFIKILSVVIAILIWMIALDTQNPFVEESISVPVKSNEGVLNKKDIELVSSNMPSNVNITIRGREQRVSKVNSNDFEVFVNFEDINSVETKKIVIPNPKYKGDQDIMITNVNPKEFDVNLEKIIAKDFPIKAKFVGELSENYRIVNYIIKPNTLNIKNIQTLINSINSIEVYTNLEDIENTSSVYKTPIAYDSRGKEVKLDNILNQVEVGFVMAKKVPLKYSIEGTPGVDKFFDSATINPEIVEITADYDTLKGITSLNVTPVDVSGVIEDFSVQSEIILPEGVKLIGDENTAEVKVKLVSNVYTDVPIQAKKIFIKNAKANEQNEPIYKYNVVTENVTIKVKGLSEYVSNIKPEAFACWIDVGLLEEGEFRLPLHIQVPNNVTLIDNYAVDVKVDKIENDEPNIGDITKEVNNDDLKDNNLNKTNNAEDNSTKVTDKGNNTI